MFRHLQKCKITVAPIFVMGSAEPKSFSRGKRAIAGTLIFIMFDSHAILSQLGCLAGETKSFKFQADNAEIKPIARGAGDSSLNTGIETASGTTLTSTNINDALNSALQVTSVGSDQTVVNAWYADQIPPFDITLAAANEYGALAAMSIIGAELLNEGYGVSIDDMVSEMQHTYVARSMSPWEPIANEENIQKILDSGASL